jgi:hypothetical protein
MPRKLAALVLATVAAAGVVTGTATSVSAAPDPTVTAQELSTTYCAFRARNDTWVRTSPGGAFAYLWKRGDFRFIPTNGAISGNWRWIATSRWVYIPAIYRDTTIACYHD